MVAHTNRMIRLLMSLKDTTYTMALINTQMVWKHHHAYGTFAWRMYEESTTSCDEEPGEISFSVLGRATKGDTLCAHHPHMNKLYQDLRIYMEASKGLRQGRKLSEFSKSGRCLVKEDSPAVAQVAAYLKGAIRALTVNRHPMYSGEKGGYRHGSVPDSKVPLAGMVRFLARDLTGLYEAKARKAHSKVTQAFMHEFSEIWPEAKSEEDAEDVAEEKAEAVNAEGEQVFSGEHDQWPFANAAEGDDVPHLEEPEHALPVAQQDGKHGADDGKKEAAFEEDEEDTDPGSESQEEDAAFAASAAVESVEPRPQDDKEERMRAYEALTQAQKNAIWRNHGNFHPNNAVGGSRKRKQTERGPYVQYT